MKYKITFVGGDSKIIEINTNISFIKYTAEYPLSVVSGDGIMINLANVLYVEQIIEDSYKYDDRIDINEYAKMEKSK